MRMSRLRASFKLVFRYCRQHVEQLRANACAKSLDLHDSKKFWTQVYKVSNNKATQYANSVGGYLEMIVLLIYGKPFQCFV